MSWPKNWDGYAAGSCGEVKVHGRYLIVIAMQYPKLMSLVVFHSSCQMGSQLTNPHQEALPAVPSARPNEHEMVQGVHVLHEIMIALTEGTFEGVPVTEQVRISKQTWALIIRIKMPDGDLSEVFSECKLPGKGTCFSNN